MRGPRTAAASGRARMRTTLSTRAAEDARARAKARWRRAARAPRPLARRGGRRCALRPLAAARAAAGATLRAACRARESSEARPTLMRRGRQRALDARLSSPLLRPPRARRLVPARMATLADPADGKPRNGVSPRPSRRRSCAATPRRAVPPWGRRAARPAPASGSGDVAAAAAGCLLATRRGAHASSGSAPLGGVAAVSTAARPHRAATWPSTPRAARLDRRAAVRRRPPRAATGTMAACARARGGCARAAAAQ